MSEERILLDHGSGGKLAHHLTTELLLPLFANPMLEELHDGALLEVNGQRLAFSTDSFTVDPLFFPGGDIGELAVYGTVNDVAMCGAQPLFLSTALIIDEGFPEAGEEGNPAITASGMRSAHSISSSGPPGRWARGPCFFIQATEFAQSPCHAEPLRAAMYPSGNGRLASRSSGLVEPASKRMRPPLCMCASSVLV